MTASQPASIPPQRAGAWQTWLRSPRRAWWRGAFFQIHLWSAIGVGLYLLFISVTGSVLVYRNELYAAANSENLWLVEGLMALHDEFLAGRAGRTLNGVGAMALLVVASTGLVIWWRGVGRWRRALTLRRNVRWKRFVWDLHSAVGFWSLAFVIVFGASGVYLCFPETFHELADRVQPPTQANAGQRLVDRVLYWLAFLHFGRIDGIGLPCNGPGLCDQTVKAIWALFGLAPAFMFVTGATMWWNRVLRRWWERAAAAAFETATRSGPSER